MLWRVIVTTLISLLYSTDEFRANCKNTKMHNVMKFVVVVYGELTFVSNVLGRAKGSFIYFILEIVQTFMLKPESRLKPFSTAF